jgi:hypothetical protein
MVNQDSGNMENRIMKKLLVVGAFATTAAVALSAAGTLAHHDRNVSRVDVTQNKGIVWFTGSVPTSFTDCNKSGTEHSSVACPIDEAYCQEMMRVALAAHLSGKMIEFETTGSCVGSWNGINRLRTQN